MIETLTDDNNQICSADIAGVASQLTTVEPELAIGLTMVGKEAMAKVLKSGEDFEYVRLGELRDRGLPIDAKCTRAVVETDFADWRRIEVSEFARHFGLNAAGDGHEVFEFQANGARYLMPALALMRALFRPHRYVLENMFRPHGLSLVCIPILGDERVRVVPTVTWQMSKDQRTLNSILEPLAWMYSFPSAYTMCGTVHDRFVEGKIGLDLPVGRVRMAIYSVSSPGANLVTAVRLVELETDEKPCEFANNQSGLVVFHNGKRVCAGRAHRETLVDSLIPRLPDGSTDLTDEEWNRIRPIFATRRKFARCHDLRVMLDGIIRKLTNGTAWKATKYSTGSWTDANTFHKRMQMNGKWDEVVAVLRDSRRAWVASGNKPFQFQFNFSG